MNQPKQRRRKRTKIHTHQAIALDSLDSVRALAAVLVYDVVSGKRSLNMLMPTASEQVSAQDAGLLQEIVYGSCRWYLYLKTIYTPHLNKPLSHNDILTECLIIVGAYQLLYMRIPTHAAINETVNAVEELKLKHHKGLVNAILRRVSENAETQELDSTQAHILSYPEWIVEKLKHNWPEHWKDILVQGNQRPPMTLRVKSARDIYINQLNEQEIESQATIFSERGITLNKAQSVEALPGFESGAVSVQDEAAQLCCELLDLKPDYKVLDACAAPGGKTCAILEQEPAIKLIALDNDEQRSQRIYDNLNRLQLQADVKVANAQNTDDWWDKQSFDRILLDAPCSASGVIRRHPDIKLLRQEEDIKVLAETQLGLLQSLWSTLKPGGKLLYATCSVFTQENSRIVERFLKSETSAKLIDIEADWGINTGFGRQLFPTQNGHDGFFYSLLEKKVAP